MLPYRGNLIWIYNFRSSSIYLILYPNRTSGKNSRIRILQLIGPSSCEFADECAESEGHSKKTPIHLLTWSAGEIILDSFE
jgi:hypothetical protein